jgi:hypothetical protein
MPHNHNISLPEAIDMTTRYRKDKDLILKQEYAGKDRLALCETFDRAAFDELLQEPSCVSVRAYFAMDNEKNVKLIFVGVNAKNEDILPSGQVTAAGGPSILEFGQRCPPICPASGPLNPQL